MLTVTKCFTVTILYSVDTHWLANRSGSSHGDKALRIYEGHSGVSSRKSKDTCVPYPRKRGLYQFSISIYTKIDLNNKKNIFLFMDEMRPVLMLKYSWRGQSASRHTFQAGHLDLIPSISHGPQNI